VEVFVVYSERLVFGSSLSVVYRDGVLRVAPHHGEDVIVQLSHGRVVGRQHGGSGVSRAMAMTPGGERGAVELRVIVIHLYVGW
jgi:hypothetical protein